eukprot:s554_g29.t1
MASPRLKKRRLQKEDSATSQVADDASVMLTASGRVALAEDIVSGAWLEKFAAENLNGFESFLGQGQALGPLGHRPGRLILTWGSACSGSEGAYFVMNALNDVFEKAKMDVLLVHKFSCESDKRKRQWIRSVVADGKATESRPEQACLFFDIADMGNSEALCDVHTGRPCQVPAVDVLVIGTSCKDLSRANSSVDRKKLVLSQATSKGGSAQTYHGFLDYVAAHQPTMIVYENVDAIDDKVTALAENNLALLMREMQERGYQGQKVMTDAQEFGLPCRRRRLYVFFVRENSGRLRLDRKAIGQVFASFRKMVSSCMRSAPCATACLLDENSEHAWAVGNALQEISESAEKAAKSKKAPQNQAWVTKHMEFAEELGVRWGVPVDPSLSANQWYWNLTKREGDVLRLSQIAAPATEFRNLSQSLGRAHGNTRQESGKHVAPTMLPGQILWSESRSRLVTGVEALIFQGFPVLRVWENLQATGQDQKSASSKTHFSDSLMTDLAGNAMALPVLLAILQAGLASVCLNPEDGEDNSEDGEGEDDVLVAALPWPSCSHDGCGHRPGFAWFCRRSLWPLAGFFQRR